MSYELAIEQRDGYLYVIVTGQNTKETITRYLAEVLTECVNRKSSRVLIEERLEGQRLGTLDVFEIASRGSSQAAGKLTAVAYVDVNADRHLMRFAEDVAVNRGLRMGVFQTVAAAEEWLQKLAKGQSNSPSGSKLLPEP